MSGQRSDSKRLMNARDVIRLGFRPMFLVLACLLLQVATADEIFGNDDAAQSIPVETAVRNAARVARVHITERKPVGPFGLVKDITRTIPSLQCGYYYTALVRQAFKGGEDTFQFFSAVDSDFQGFDRDYLVFAYEREPSRAEEAVARLADVLTASQHIKLRCKTFGAYFVPVQPQLFRTLGAIPVDGKNVEILLNSTRDSVVWCESELGKPDISMRTVRGKVGGVEDEVAEWVSIRSLIEAAVSRRYKFWSPGQIDPC